MCRVRVPVVCVCTQIVEVLEDWVQVTRLSDGQTGLVPSAYVQ